VRDLGTDIRKLEQDQEALESFLDPAKPTVLRVEKVVHAGVRIQIGNSHLKIDKTRPGCTFRRDPETEEIKCI